MWTFPAAGASRRRGRDNRARARRVPQRLKMNSQRLSPTLGVEIVGFDARELSDDDFGQIHEYLVEGAGVLVLRDQTLEPEQHIAFSRKFGDLFGEAEPLQNTVTRYLHPDHPQIFRVSNKEADGQP
ncbi:TPA: hypothetical protein DCE37_04515, partial [Candidatus Latescibacteria bacterium]|nr:hypothetical protein [Candidatus Latescibacterota bacterium]